MQHDSIEEDFEELERRVLQASNEYLQMFNRSKLLLQENRSILNQIGGGHGASRQSKIVTPSLTPRILNQSTSVRGDLTLDINKLDKVQQVQTIVKLLREMDQQNPEESVEEQSSRYNYNIGKYDAGPL
jgi:hypothetical protein